LGTILGNEVHPPGTITTFSKGSTVRIYGNVEPELITNRASVAAANGDKILISDVSDSGNLKYVTASSIAGLGGGGGGSDSFETVAKNLAADDATFNYTGDQLDSIDYSSGITKTFNYTGDTLDTIVLSGATPGGIALTKTFTYTGDALTDIAYT
jgi:hypothetical protein